MKCLALDGDTGLRIALIKRLSAIDGISLGVLDPDKNGSPVVHYMNSEPRSILGSILPDVLVVPADPGVAAPVVLCGAEGTPCPLTIARFIHEGDSCGDIPVLTPNSPDTLFLGMLDRIFPALPQHTAEECGRCGMDCRKLAERVIAGLAVIGDCRVLAPFDGVRVISGERVLELGEFPSRVVESTIRGLVSVMKGYVEGAGVSVQIGPVRNRVEP
jgi:hypothetical protein